MLNIKDVLVYVYNGVKKKDPRFKIEDDEHVIDTKTGVEFHLYDDGGKVTHGEDLIAKMEYFTKDEQSVLFELKKLITDPVKVQKKIAHYPVMLKEAREVFAGLFESPQPTNVMEPELEANTTPYRG